MGNEFVLVKNNKRILDSSSFDSFNKEQKVFKKDHSEIIMEHKKENIYNFFINESIRKLDKNDISKINDDSACKFSECKNSEKIRAVEGDQQANDEFTYENKKSSFYDSEKKLSNVYSTEQRRFNTDCNFKENLDNKILINFEPLSIRPFRLNDSEDNFYKKEINKNDNKLSEFEKNQNNGSFILVSNKNNYCDQNFQFGLESKTYFNI